MKPLFFFFWLFKQFALRSWFRAILVSGKHNIPRSGPLIIIGNHSNAFMDPILVAILLRRGIYSLARGDVFKGKFLNSLFSSLHMLPIFRRRDGIENLKKNTSTFERCWKLLSQGKVILIYPEGDCVQENHLRPFRPGLNTLVFEAYKHYPEIQEIPIVPVGITYTEFMKWQSPVYVSFGEAVLTKSHLQDYILNENQNFDHILTECHDALQKQMLDIPRNNILEVEVKTWLRAYRRKKFGSFLQQLGFGLQSSSALESEQAILSAYQKQPTVYPGSFQKVTELAKQGNLVATEFLATLQKKRSVSFISILGNGLVNSWRLLTYPILLVFHLIGTAAANKIAKEPEFWASVRYGISFILGLVSILLTLIILLIYWLIQLI